MLTNKYNNVVFFSNFMLILITFKLGFLIILHFPPIYDGLMSFRSMMGSIDILV